MNKTKRDKVTHSQSLTINYYPHKIQSKLVIKMLFFQTKQDDIYVNTILSILCRLVWCLKTSLWIYSWKPRVNNRGQWIIFFSKIRNDKIYLYKGYLQDYSLKNTNQDKKIMFESLCWQNNVELSVWYIIYNHLWGRANDQNK